jgi:hypothetical protein
MKIRNGFVSNSSSCSFLIYGMSFDPSDLSENQLKSVKEQCINILKNYNSDNEYFKRKAKNILKDLLTIDDEEFMCDFHEYMREIIDFNDDLDFYDYQGECYIGEEPTKADDNLTFGEWKKSVEEDIKFLIPFSEKFTWIEECWQDG